MVAVGGYWETIRTEIVRVLPVICNPVLYSAIIEDCTLVSQLGVALCRRVLFLAASHDRDFVLATLTSSLAERLLTAMQSESELKKLTVPLLKV